MIYVTYDGGGNLTGGYIQPLDPAHAGNYLEVTADQCTHWTSYKVVAGALQALTPTVDDAGMKTQAILEYKHELQPLITQLVGIGFAALAISDSATVSDVLVARQLLIDIATRPGVVAAVGGDATIAALATEYTAIVAATPSYIKAQII